MVRGNATVHDDTVYSAAVGEHEVSTKIDFEVDKDSAVPPYSQLRRAIIAARAEGKLVAGDRLPPMRTLATRLGLAVNTVAKTYKELEAAGVIETHGRAGSFITAPDGTTAKAHTLTASYITSMRKLGYDDDQILAMTQHELGLDDTIDGE